MERNLVIHPFLFAVFPVIFIYANSLDEDYSLFEIVILLGGIILISTTLIFLVINIFIRNKVKSGIIVSLLIALFFSYGFLCDIPIIHDFLLSDFGLSLQYITIGTHKILLFLLAGVFLLATHFILNTKRDLINFSRFLNIVSISLISISLINIGAHALNSNFSNDQFNNNFILNDSIEGNTSTEFPDIYYIILDAYASQSTLKEMYGYDNQEFIDYLTGKGFFIADESRSNYAITPLSLASSLNMQYINYLSNISGENSKDLRIFNDMIENNKAMQVLKSRGYRFVFFSSGYPMTENNRYADLSYNAGIQYKDATQSQFLVVLIRATMLRPFLLYSNSYLFNDYRKRISSTFSQLGDVPEINGPKFIFAHIVCPHPPFVFGRNGEEVSVEGGWGGPKEPYLNQLIFINNRTELLIQKILTKGKISPIIILQADHGPNSKLESDNESSNNSQLSKGLIKQKMRILNAYYIPKDCSIPLYNSVTPVNTFRLIFNALFNTKYELLGDQSYYSTYESPYVFLNVTNSTFYS